ncbi:primosomal protein [Microbacterium deminutum]|uniref:Primosomal protein n=1 Tax=Microbacterium deminutum TaxID=344164 RepID=A0ABN2QAK8_9MICO
MAEQESRDDRTGRESRPRSDHDPRPPRGSGAGKKPHQKHDGERKSYPPRDGERKSYPPRDGERKSYPPRDGNRKPYAASGGSKPYPPRDGERKSYPPRDGERKSYPPRDGERKSYPPRDGNRKPYAASGGSKPYPPRDGERKSYPPRDGERKSYPPRDGERKSYPPRDGNRKPYAASGGSKPSAKYDGERKSYPPRDGERKSYPPRGGAQRTDRPARGGVDRPDHGQRPDENRPVRPRHDDPFIPDDITAADLNAGARNELKTLSKENAEWVARHLAMASKLIDVDPELAHQHALSASRRAGRIAIVRETLAITAYATGDFALALRELRTYRRISGRDDQIALMVDSERGVGRPDRALEVGRAVDQKTLPTGARVELAIAMSGARLDLDQPDRALLELDIPELDPDRAFEWSPALFAARAIVLEELGRDSEAEEWHRRAEVAADALDAASGLGDLETVIVEEVEEQFIDDSPEEQGEQQDVVVETSDRSTSDEPLTEAAPSDIPLPQDD